MIKDMPEPIDTEEPGIPVSTSRRRFLARGAVAGASATAGLALAAAACAFVDAASGQRFSEPGLWLALAA
jgi:hypothetical protein